MDARKRLWIYSGLALLGGVGLVVAAGSGGSVAPPGHAPTPTRKRIRPGARVLLLGDSLAVGLKVPMAQLALDSGAAFAAHGIVGSRIANWANSPTLASDMSFNPTLVLLSLGTNDMKMTSPGAEAGDLSALLAKLRAGGAEVIILAPPTMPFPDHGVRNMLAASGATIFPSDALSIPRGPDGIHPTVRGYGGWSGAIWAWL